MVDFYRSPLGTRFREALPAVREESQTAAKAYVASIGLGPVDDGTKMPTTTTPEPDFRSYAVHTLLRESGALERSRTAMLEMIERLRRRADPQTAPEFWDAAQRRLTDDDALLAVWTPAYVHHFPDSDIQDLTAFFRSPLGKRYVKALPAIQKESVAAAAALGKQAARRAIREVLGPLPQWKLQHPEANGRP
jgi:hypothetical protein